MKLGELASVVRSKNSGPFELTLDAIFPDAATFEAVRVSGALTPESVAAAYGIDPSLVIGVVYFAPANAIKATLVRPVASGDICDTDIYGAQQHAPFMNIEVN